MSTASRPCWLVSHCVFTGLLTWTYFSTGSLQHCSFSLRKASSCAGCPWNKAIVFSSSLRVASKSLRLEMNFARYVTNPRNCFTSSLFFGIGMARAAAATFDGSGFNPSDVRRCPMYGTAGCLIKPWLLMIQLQVVAGFSFDDLAKHCACVMMFSIWSCHQNVIHNSCSLYSLEHLIHDFLKNFGRALDSKRKTCTTCTSLLAYWTLWAVKRLHQVWLGRINPLFATRFENTLASGTVMMTFSVALIGWCSRFMTLFKSLGSIQMRTLSP